MRIPAAGPWGLLPMAIAFWIASELIGGLGRVAGIH
jgi:hypothetical protein